MARILLALLMAVFLLPANSVGAAQKKTRIVVIETMSVPVVQEHSRWFMDEMAKLGYVDGKNAVFEVIKARGDKKRAMNLLAEAMEKGEPDVVVTFATLASQAACETLKGSKIPIIFAVVSDPVGAGLVKQVGVPSGSNITGRVFTLFRKIKVDMAMRLLAQRPLGRPVRFGIIHSSYPSARGDVAKYQKIAKSRGGLKFVTHEITYRKMPQGLGAMLVDYQRAIEQLKERVDYWWQVTGPLGEVEESTALLLRTDAVPLLYGNTMQSVKNGALFTINANYREGGCETARLVHTVLKGSDPGKIPVVPPPTFDLGVNLSTALKLGIAIPSDIMTMAGERVYR
jgi:putative ABC transport system substrate-binding protein